MRIGMGTTGLAVERRAGVWGGIARYSESLLNCMRETFREHEFSEATFAIGSEWLRNPLRHHAASVLVNAVLGRRTSAKRIFNQNFDLFHALDQKVPALSIPVVATIHDAKFLAMPNLTSSSTQYIKRSLFIRKCRLADRVIAVSNYAAAEISAHIGIDRKRIDVVYEGVADHILNEATKEQDWQWLTRKYGLRNSYIAYCGRIARTKNVPRLIEAFLAIPAVLRKRHSLVLIGNVTADEGGVEISKEIRNAEREGEVRWLGGLPNEDMARIVHHATAFAFPSLHEGFGLPILEAMYLGVPVVTANAAALPEVAGDAALLVDPREVGEISAALRALLEDEELRHDLSARGRDRARQFSWERCAKETFEVYKRVLRSF